MSQPLKINRTDSDQLISPVRGPLEGMYQDLSTSLPRNQPWLFDHSAIQCTTQETSPILTLRKSQPTSRIPSREQSPNRFSKLSSSNDVLSQPNLEDLSCLSCCLFEGISSRAACNLADCWLLAEGMAKLAAKPFDPISSPDGIINAGSAENKLMVKELLEKFNDSTTFKVEPKMLFYGCYFGSEQFRQHVANLINRRFHPAEPLLPTNVTAFAGCAATISALVQVVCDQGEAILLPAPYFGGFQPHLEYQARTIPFPIHLDSSNDFGLDMDKFDEAIKDAREKGLHVRALLLCHPNNPFGTCYTRDELIQVMQFCKRENLHLIVDEIYALSTFQGTFTSSLSISPKQVPGGFDPTRLHVVYGMSKDFCLNGIRVGYAFSRSPRVLGALHKIAFFHNCSSLVDATMCNFLSDTEWVDDFISTNQSRLKESYKVLLDYCSSHDISFLPATAGFFVYLDLRKWVKLISSNLQPVVHLDDDEHIHEDRTAERQLWNKFLDKGVYIAPGEAFHTHELGWFRLCFANSEWKEPKHSTLLLGLERIRQVLNDVEEEYK